MRILCLTSDLKQTGGIQQYNKALIDALRNEGQRVTCVERQKGGIMKKVWFSIRSVISGITKKPDLILCMHINFIPIAHLLSRIIKRPYIVTTHGIEIWNIKKETFKRLLRKAKIVVTVSKYSKERIQKQIPELKNIYILPNTINENEFRPTEPDRRLQEKWNITGKKVILTVARLAKEEKY